MALSVGWQGSAPNPEHPPLANEFREIVDQAVWPVMDERNRGVYHVYLHSSVLAISSLRVASRELRYMFFRPEAIGPDGGLQGLNFTPSHAVEVIADKGQAMFGLREDGTVVRALAPRHAIGSMFMPPRELDETETEALVRFVEKPHLLAGKLAVATRLTAQESLHQAESVRRSAQIAEELQRDLDEIEAAHRRGMEEMLRNPTIFG